MLRALAQRVQESSALQRALRQAVHEPSAANVFEWEAWASQLPALAGGPQFLADFQTLLRQFMDVAFGGLRLSDEPTPLLRNILEMASQTRSPVARAESDDEATTRALEQRLLDAVGAVRHDEAWEVLRPARLSWQLRDDDNLLNRRPTDWRQATCG